MNNLTLEGITFENALSKALFLHTMDRLAVRLDLFVANGLVSDQGRYFDEGLQAAVFEMRPKFMQTPIIMFMSTDRQIFITADNVFAGKQFQRTAFGIGIVRAVTVHLGLDLAIIDAETGESIAEFAGKQ